MNAQRLLEKQEEFGRHVIEQTAMMQTILNAARFLTPSNREYVARLIREIRDADQPDACTRRVDKSNL